MPVHSTFANRMLKAGIVVAICDALTILWQGRVDGFANNPTAAETAVSRVFPMLRIGPYQDNLAIQVVEEAF